MRRSLLFQDQSISVDGIDNKEANVKFTAILIMAVIKPETVFV